MIGKVLKGAALAALGLAVIGGAAQAQTLTIIRAADAATFDPQRALPVVTSEVVFMMGDTLVALDPDMKKIHPLLAKSWTISPDGKTYTFELRDDVTFCSGKKMTSEDVVYSFKRMFEQGQPRPSAQKMGKVKDIRADGPYKVIYELNEGWNELLAHLSLMHGTILNKENVDALGKDFGLKGFDGTGPYCWESWTPRNEMVLKRHDAYKWGPEFYANRGPAKFQKVVWKVVPEDQTRVAAMLTGQADISSYMPNSSIAQLKASPALDVKQVPNYYRTCFFGFKSTRDLVSDVKVRRAMNMAIDRAGIAQTVFFGNATPATTLLHPDTQDYYAPSAQPLAKFDIEGAKKLLDEAGWKVGEGGWRYKDGKKLEPVLIHVSAGTTPPMATAAQGMLRQIGVDMKLESLDSTIFFSRWAQQDYDLFALCNPYFSAGDVLNVYWRSENIPVPNNMMWKDADTDKWLDAARQALDAKTRAENYGKVQQKVSENAVWIPLVYDNIFLVSNKKLKGVKTHAIFTSPIYKGLDLSF
jgi:peptide/nickel transport system substrate-binding protein